MTCPTCRLTNFDRVGFCKGCGTPLNSGSPLDEAAAPHCPHCGMRSVLGGHFCQQCGSQAAPGLDDQPIGNCRNCGVLWRRTWLFCRHCGVARAQALIDLVLNLPPQFERGRSLPLWYETARPAELVAVVGGAGLEAKESPEEFDAEAGDVAAGDVAEDELAREPGADNGQHYFDWEPPQAVGAANHHAAQLTEQTTESDLGAWLVEEFPDLAASTPPTDDDSPPAGAAEIEPADGEGQSASGAQGVTEAAAHPPLIHLPQPPARPLAEPASIPGVEAASWAGDARGELATSAPRRPVSGLVAGERQSQLSANPDEDWEESGDPGEKSWFESNRWQLLVIAFLFLLILVFAILIVFDIRLGDFIKPGAR